MTPICIDVTTTSPRPNGGDAGVDAVAFLRLIQPEPGGGERVEGRFIGRDRRCVRRFFGSADALAADAARYAASMDCYVGVALRRGPNGTAEGVGRAQAVWWEVDAKLFADAPNPKEAALLVIDEFPLPPTAVVDSGGGYPGYHVLAEPVPLDTPAARARLEAVNAAMARGVCGPGRTPDAVHDVARVLRLPGTWNRKPAYPAPLPVRVVAWRPDVRYELGEIEARLRRDFAWAFRSPRAPDAVQARSIEIDARTSTSGCDEAALRRVGHETRRLLGAAGAGRYKSASEADAAVAAALIRAGLAADEAYGLLAASVRGADARRRKGRHGEYYLKRTVAHAAAFVGPVVRREGSLRVRYPGEGYPLRRAYVPPPAAAKEVARW
jgi:hypothetical protein